MGRANWRAWLWRAGVALATLLWLVSWGRLVAVGATQPSRWHEIDTTLADGTPVADRREYSCRLNAFQRDGLIYRLCDRGTAQMYLVAVDPARRSAVVRWELPVTFARASWFAGVAVDPAGGLTILSAEEGGIALLRDDGSVTALPAPNSNGLLYGFGWQNGQLELVSATFDAAGGAGLDRVAYRPGAGWVAQPPLPAPDCPPDQSCTPLVASATAQGWVAHYARAPRQPADPALIQADILRVAPDGATTVPQTVALTAASRAFLVQEGQLRWASRIADRTGGNLLNYGGFTALQQSVDGRFVPLPTPPDDLFEPNPRYQPDRSSLVAAYRLAPDRLHWLPVYDVSGFAGGNERALLLPDRWVVLQETAAGVHLEERPRDPTASYPDGTFTSRGPLILGQQAEIIGLSDYSSPLLPDGDGGYWLVGRFNTVIHAGPDLRRLDERGPLDRFGTLFADFGTLADRFHQEQVWPKRLALGWALFGWPLLALVAIVRDRLARHPADAPPTGLQVAALLALPLGLAALPWFWMASRYF